jgi:chromosome segregation protein
VRRITRDAGSAYKANAKDVRARDVQMLFADASTGAHSPALVRQGQISELINAKPKNAPPDPGGSGRDLGPLPAAARGGAEAEGRRGEPARVDDVIEAAGPAACDAGPAGPAGGALPRDRRGAAAAEGLLLYRRWREADEARARPRTCASGCAPRPRPNGGAGRGRPPRGAGGGAAALREEEAIAAAILQRLTCSATRWTIRRRGALAAIAR